MVDESERYDLQAIRELLLDAFNAEDLHGLFFFSQNEVLQKVPDEFAKGDSLPAMVRKAVRYCRSRHVLGEMLAEVKVANPNAYEQYASKLRSSPAPPPHQPPVAVPASDTRPTQVPGRIPVWGLVAALAVVVAALAVVLVLLLREPGPVSKISEPTSTHTPTDTPTYTFTSTPTGTPTPTLTPSPTGTLTSTFTSTPSETPTFTPTPSETPTFTPTPYIDVEASPPQIEEGSCTRLRWDIQNVEVVYLDNYVVAREGEQQVCPTKDTTYTWRIVRFDGSELLERETVQVIPLGSIIAHYVGTWVGQQSSSDTVSYALVRLMISEGTTDQAGILSACRSDPDAGPILLGPVDAEIADRELVTKKAFFLDVQRTWTLRVTRSASGLQAIVKECLAKYCYTETFELEKATGMLSPCTAGWAPTPTP